MNKIDFDNPPRGIVKQRVWDILESRKTGVLPAYLYWAVILDSDLKEDEEIPHEHWKQKIEEFLMDDSPDAGDPDFLFDNYDECNLVYRIMKQILRECNK